MKLSLFITLSVIIFFIERALQAIFIFPVFIFPVFAVLLFLGSKDEVSDLVSILVLSLFFDFFSGFNFGIYALAIFIVCITIYFLKSQLNVSSRNFVSSLTLVVIFTFEFFLILSLASSVRVLISQALIIIVETLFWVIILKLVFAKLNASIK